MFADTVGLTIHDYVQRRQLTEAAKLLVLSDQPILEIALSAGYESQQSFTDIFRAMYKKSPNQYRAEGEFYPLQLRYVLNENSANLEKKEWQDKIVFAAQEDIPKWIELVHLVIDGFPHLDEKQYLEHLQEYIKNKRALYKLARSAQISVTTFREGDKADTGYRKIWGSLGFAQAELLTEFGYPTQRFILQKAKDSFCSNALQKEKSEGRGNG